MRGSTIAALGLLGLGLLLAGTTPSRGFMPWPVPLEAIEKIGDALGAPRRHGPHQGLDIFCAAGTPVLAPVDCTIVHVIDGERAGTLSGLDAGLFIDARTASGDVLRFLHLRIGSVRVKPGESVKAGTELAQVADAGTSGLGTTRPHLHFEVREAPEPGRRAYGTAINPLSVLPYTGRPLIDKQIVARLNPSPKAAA